jgi:hypothetical protein
VFDRSLDRIHDFPKPKHAACLDLGALL